MQILIKSFPHLIDRYPQLLLDVLTQPLILGCTVHYLYICTIIGVVGHGSSTSSTCVRLMPDYALKIDTGPWLTGSQIFGLSQSAGIRPRARVNLKLEFY